jgi:hypothetical protein
MRGPAAGVMFSSPSHGADPWGQRHVAGGIRRQAPGVRPGGPGHIQAVCQASSCEAYRSSASGAECAGRGPMVPGLSGAWFPGYQGGPGSDGLSRGIPRSCRHGLAGTALGGPPVPPVPCGRPLVPTGPQSAARIFSNHAILPGAPLRNRTVDLLLTMDRLVAYSPLACPLTR